MIDFKAAVREMANVPVDIQETEGMYTITSAKSLFRLGTCLEGAVAVLNRIPGYKVSWNMRSKCMIRIEVKYER